MPAQPLVLLPAREAGFPVIVKLIKEAAEWLRTQGTDQWARPWPDEAGLHARICCALREGRSWICWDGAVPAATITADPRLDPYWADTDPAEPAVYVHRLVVSRAYSRNGLGAALLDWAGRTGRRDHGARWIRVSAWTTNYRLHAYYRRQGFVPKGLHVDKDYPSGALFQKPTASIPPAESPLFRQV